MRVSNSLDLAQARHFVGPELGPNCLQTLSADDTSWQRINALPSSLTYLSCRQAELQISRRYEPQGRRENS